MMRFIAIAGAVLLIAGVAAAQEYHFEFQCDGVGNMLQDSPPVYTGDIFSGDLAPGSWLIQIDDTGWPGTGDPVARWDYLYLNYYVYDPGPGIWTGTFEDNYLYVEKTGQGSMQGIASMEFQIIDFDYDGVIDPEECIDGLSGAVIIIEDGTGIYATLCGQGTYQGGYDRDCYVANPTYGLDDVWFTMYLDLDECGMATEASTWSAVKSLFK
jgi:hypothetical protein